MGKKRFFLLHIYFNCWRSCYYVNRNKNFREITFFVIVQGKSKSLKDSPTLGLGRWMQLSNALITDQPQGTELVATTASWDRWQVETEELRDQAEPGSDQSCSTHQPWWAPLETLICLSWSFLVGKSSVHSFNRLWDCLWVVLEIFADQNKCKN